MVSGRARHTGREVLPSHRWGGESGPPHQPLDGSALEKSLPDTILEDEHSFMGKKRLQRPMPVSH